MHNGQEVLLVHEGSPVLQPAEASQFLRLLHQLLTFNPYTHHTVSRSPPLLRLHLLSKDAQGVPVAMQIPFFLFWENAQQAFTHNFVCVRSRIMPLSTHLQHMMEDIASCA